ncbi:MAG: hypothetical protein AB7Q00_16050 [Phycisphaerales bacterium]
MELACKLLSSHALAAWVQAVGTILALVIAILAPIWHSNRVERRRTATEVSSILAIAQRALSAVEYAASHSQPDRFRIYCTEEFSAHEFNLLLRRLREIPLHTLKDSRLAEPVANLADGLARLTGQLETRAGQFAARIDAADTEWQSHADDSIDLTRRSVATIRQVMADYE